MVATRFKMVSETMPASFPIVKNVCGLNVENVRKIDSRGISELLGTTSDHADDKCFSLVQNVRGLNAEC